MVLTNIELWAADGSTGSPMPLDFETNNPHARHINPFDPRAVPQMNTNLNHLSSNGYYGFSYVNAAHNIEVNNNYDNNISNINNNNTTTCNLMSNDVNGVNNNNATATLQQQTYALSASFGGSACAAGHTVNVARCKKRSFVMNDDDVISDCSSTKNYCGNNSEVSAKRCRFDDDFSAQYFNDFFQLPSTQIGTQSCLMDTEEGLQPQQLQQYHEQQVDAAMLEGNNNNIEKYEQKLNLQLSDLSAHHQHEQHSQQTQTLLQQQQQHHQQQEPEQTQQQQQQQQHLYHQQQHYQGHLHRANRDVSRCMLSHMI